MRGGPRRPHCVSRPRRRGLSSQPVLRDAGVNSQAEGGVTGAARRVLTAFPDHIPEANTPLDGTLCETARRAKATCSRRSGPPVLTKDDIGDVLPHQDGLSVVVLPRAKDAALKGHARRRAAP